MDAKKSPSTQGGGQGHQYRRTREDRRSLSESLADGTSKFFSSMVAKKNGLFNDLSSKIENTFASKPDAISNSVEGPPSPASTQPVPSTPPPRPPPPKRLPSVGSAREKESVMKRMASMPAYTRTDSRPEFVPDARNQRPNHKGPSSEERFSLNGMNVSFDEPIYNKREPSSSQGVSETFSESPTQNTHNTNSRHASESSSTSPQPKPAPRSNKPGRHEDTGSGSYRSDGHSAPTAEQPKHQESDGGLGTRPVTSIQESGRGGCTQRDERSINAAETRQHPVNNNKSEHSRNESIRNNEQQDSKSGANKSATDGTEEQITKQKAPKFTTTKRRSSTVDEMLFDDYVEPEIDDVISKDAPPENLISFEPDWEAEQAGNSSDTSSEGNDQVVPGTSVDSSDAEFGGAPMHRSASVGSEKSWSSCYSVDSQPDDVTLECMEFMKSFVDKVFHTSEDISQTEKAKFGELCQYFPGRLWFSRYVNSQRVHNKKVTEAILFRLVQYFAVCLFECNEAEDFSPAKTLMNMCFTFYYEVPTPQGQTEKVFLYMYLRDQPIWQSLRFWNAAYFDAVQCERSRRPMPTNSDGNETVSDDKQFQENITFGQLGTFACNMRAFGLCKELCLEFIRKQSTIANLRKDQVKLLRENIEKVNET